MKLRLPPQYHGALDLRSVLHKGALHRAILKLASLYNEDFGMVCPPLNAPLLIFKHMRELGLPCKSRISVDICMIEILREISGNISGCGSIIKIVEP